MTATSGLIDTFDTRDEATWDFVQVTVAGGKAALSVFYGATQLKTVDTYVFDSIVFEFELNLAAAPDGNVSLGVSGSAYPNWSVPATNAGPMAHITVNIGVMKPRYVLADGTYTEGPDITYSTTAHRFLQFRQAAGLIHWEASPDGATWTSLWTASGTITVPVRPFFGDGWAASLLSVNATSAPGPGDPGYDPVGTQPADVPDNFTPDATVPAEPTPPECRTLLSLVQEFSALVKRAVRITGPNSIEMVDPNAPLPAGWYIEDAAEMFTTTEHAIQAGAEGVSYAYEDLEMTASATLIRDDVRLLASTWRIPDRVPAYELQAGPVKRITHTFTPKDYTASIEYHVPTVPLTARRP